MDLSHQELLRFAQVNSQVHERRKSAANARTFSRVSSSPMNALTSPRPRNHDCGLTLRSSGLAPAGRLWPSFHSGPKPSCRRQPLTLNVRPQKKRKNMVAAFQSRRPFPCPRGCNVACSKSAKQSFAISKNMRGALNFASSGGNTGLLHHEHSRFAHVNSQAHEPRKNAANARAFSRVSSRPNECNHWLPGLETTSAA